MAQAQWLTIDEVAARQGVRARQARNLVARWAGQSPPLVELRRGVTDSRKWRWLICAACYGALADGAAACTEHPAPDAALAPAA